MAVKKCTKCGELRLQTLFRKRAAARDGLASHCDLCRLARKRERYANDPEYRRMILDRQRAKNAENPEKNRKKARDWVIANPDKARETQRKMRQRNLAASNAYQREWAKQNRQKTRAACARRFAKKLNATPLWANSFFIAEAYRLALLREKHTGIKWHVDHIVPLQGETVCGLHCESNLAVIPARENIMKNNRHWPDMP